MSPAVIAFEGPVGVGKSTLGQAVSEKLQFGFIDGDDYSKAGPWLRSILRTSWRIAASCERQLRRYPAVILAYPLRCKEWLFFRETFRRRGIVFCCVSLSADLLHIANRDRALTRNEIERTSQMIEQGYGQRQFSDLVIRTDEGSFDETRDHLASEVSALLTRSAC